MKRNLILIYFIFFSGALIAQVKISSWNLQNLGKTKTEAEIKFIANTLTDFDIIALQEVVAGYGGPQAVARLADELNRSGSKWDYVISDPTKSSSPQASKRYAYIWKTSKVTLVNRPWLEKKYEDLIDREPFLASFKYQDQEFTLVNFHAIPKKKTTRNRDQIF